MAFFIALAYWVINSEGGELSDIRGYTPKTRSVGTRPLGPAVSLIAFTASYKVTSDSALVSARIIAYTQRKAA
ncbi:hypothetical protein LX36DRAFT_736772 [Colletotrichum falcatum]|nr:hypothetical protein LX36DRAFT_736772 [Colletotrichum falcatum]